MRLPRVRVLSDAPIRVAVIIMATLLHGGGTISGADNHSFTEVMRRAHDYTVIYEDHELSTVRAREDYQQQWLTAAATNEGRAQAELRLFAVSIAAQRGLVRAARRLRG